MQKSIYKSSIYILFFNGFADVVPPVFLSCPSDIRASLDANSSAVLKWKIPVALDNSNQAPQIIVSPSGVAPPYTFYNTTLIVYTAIDARGNEEECSFKILLEGQYRELCYFLALHVTWLASPG